MLPPPSLFDMSLLHHIVALSASGKYFCSLKVSESFRYPTLEEAYKAAVSDADRLVEAHALVERGGGRVLALFGGTIFFESDVESSVEGVTYYPSREAFENAMAETKEVSYNVSSDDSLESDAEMLGYQIEADDWSLLEAVFDGETSTMPETVFAFLKEAGLVEGDASDVKITDFGRQWLERDR